MGQSEPELRIRTLALVVLPLVASPLASKFRVPRSVQPPQGKLRPHLVFQAFSFRVHDLAFWTKPPKVVWNLLLQGGSEGPSLIGQTVAHSNSLLAALVLVSHDCRSMKGRAPYLAVVERKLSTTTSTLTR
jgi:hypothetical protein